ncbi:hypothetical protein ACH47C_31265 [Streptomyces rishiriensis]|uniref:hypothetical protein n=1 Tax=Streptomyces rishiriensis TaxID=68264 RepID=UPI0033C8D739
MDLNTPGDHAKFPPRTWASQPSFTEFYASEVKRIVLFVYKNGATWDDAWDATQSAFVGSFQRWDGIDDPAKYVRRAALLNWVFEVKRCGGVRGLVVL